MLRLLLLVLTVVFHTKVAAAWQCRSFVTHHHRHRHPLYHDPWTTTTSTTLAHLFSSHNPTNDSSSSADNDNRPPQLQRVSAALEGIPLAFVDTTQSNFLECFADVTCVIDNVEYTIGSPCDTAVAICTFVTEQELVPLELDDPRLDKVFPIAQAIVADGTYRTYVGACTCQ